MKNRNYESTKPWHKYIINWVTNVTGPKSNTHKKIIKIENSIHKKIVWFSLSNLLIRKEYRISEWAKFQVWKFLHLQKLAHGLILRWSFHAWNPRPIRKLYSCKSQPNDERYRNFSMAISLLTHTGIDIFKLSKLFENLKTYS